MPSLLIKITSGRAAAEAEGSIQNRLENIQQSIYNVSHNLNSKMAALGGIKSSLAILAGSVEHHKNSVGNMKRVLETSLNLYEKTEKNICDYASGTVGKAKVLISESVGAVVANWGTEQRIKWVAEPQKADWNNLLWSLVGNCGVIGKSVSASAKFVTGDTEKIKPWWDSFKSGAESIKKVYGAVKSAKKDKVSVNWKEVLFGLNKQAEVPKGIVNGFKAGVAEEAKKTSISSVLLSLVGNGISNYDEYKSGEIDIRRAVQETFMETAVDIGKGVVVSGIVTAGFAAMGIAAPPVLAVAAVGTAVKWGADLICQKITGGKKVTEAVSDLILDVGQEVGKTVGKAVTSAKKKIGAVWNSLKPKWLFA